EFAAHAHPIERGSRRAIEAYLDRFNAKRLQARAVIRREEVTIGFDLELAVARAYIFDHLEEQRVDHRLSARKRQIRNLMVHELLENVEDLPFIQLIAKCLAGAAFLDAVKAGEVALVRHLARDIKRRAEV